MSVEPRPASTTSSPSAATPAAKARASPGEVARMSWAMTTASRRSGEAFSSCAKARPSATAVRSSHC